MGRGKVQLKRIEDKISRQVTFSKRKGGLLKKANELAVLCEVDVALLIFSDRGRLYEFCSAESLAGILERYKIHVDEEVAVCKRAEQEKNNVAECTDLQTTANPLHMIQRQLDTQNIEQKTVTELTELERELDAILRQTRFRKTQLMMEAVKAVQQEKQMKREKQLRQEKTCMEEEMAAMVSTENPNSLHKYHLLQQESNTNSNYQASSRQDTALQLF